MLAVSAALFGSAVACPGSYSPIHASARINVEFQSSCAEVAEEIKMRAGAANGVWTDPHNQGIYALETATDNYIKVKRTTKNGQFTDRSDFKLTANGAGCSVEGCSESQGISAADQGTNFCDMYSLFCGSKNCAGGTCCKVLKNDLAFTVTKKQCGPLFFSCPGGEQSQANTCIKNPSTEEELAELQADAILLSRMGAFTSEGLLAEGVEIEE